MAAAGAVTVIVGAIVAVHSLPSELGLTHEARATHRAITLAPVNLNHASLADFKTDVGDHDSAALPSHGRGPRFALAATRDGALLAQVAATGDAVSSDAAAGGGSGASAGQDEPAPGPNGSGETNPTPTPTPPETTSTPTEPGPTPPPTPTDTTSTPNPPPTPGPGEPPLPSSTEARVLSPAVPIVVPKDVTVGDLQHVTEQVQISTGLVGAGCAGDVTRRCPAFAEMMAAALTDSDGRPVSVAVAVERLERALPQMRRVQTADGPSVDGTEVDVTVHTQDLKGVTIFVKWQLIERGTGRLQLYGKWLSANSMYRLIPTSDDDDTDLVLWVPLPPRRGSYGIRLLAYVDGVRMKHKDVPLKL